MTFHPRVALMTCALALSAVLGACSSTTSLDEAPVETRTPTAVDSAASAAEAAAAAAARAAAANQSSVTTVDLSKSGNAADAAAMAQRVVYFDYDSYIVKDEYRPMLEAHAKALRADRNKRLMLEGHTDDRGGREYNLALGQKRAESVLKTLVLMGVAEGQLEAVSFGKERPAVSGSDEASMAKNRRVELKDK